MLRRFNQRMLLFLSLAMLCGSAIRPASAQSTQTEMEFFETKVRPLLHAQCVGCHGESLRQSGLRLDRYADAKKGGKLGAPWIAGKPDESLLIRAVNGSHPSLKMPPSAPLKPEQIAILIQWVQRGAYWTTTPVKPIAAPPALWSVRPVRRPQLPTVRNKAWARNTVDAFVLKQLESKGMVPAPPASKRELIRRATFDLTGLPPSPEEVARFVADTTPNAYEKLLDRLLASPRYGERWGRYWLDLVRYADTNGYERDADKPFAYKYRDYVIRAFNEDRPYDRFVFEQLAGDELTDKNETTLTATGFLRIGTWDDEPNDPLQYKYERLDDLVHAASTVFLGLTVRCARCHDHKFDPISQKEYYGFAASFFGGYLDPADAKLMGGPPPERIGKPLLAFTDKGREAPPLHLLKNGDPRRREEEVAPGYLAIAKLPTTPKPLPPAETDTTRRRTQLAHWITDPNNPLTARVMVNRLWKHHFGQGLSRTPNNFGSKGMVPTHPELLDWLAYDFRTNGWRIKRIHKLLMTSNTYRMSSQHPSQSAYNRKDAQNLLLWRMNRQRLDADALRDAFLSVSGELNPKMGGAGFLPTVPREALEGLSRKGAEWNPSEPSEQRRRSVYMHLKRAMLLPLLTVFDFGDTTAPLEQRDITTVAPQALALLNNPFIHEQANAFALRLEREAGKDRTKQVERAWQLSYGRLPSKTERQIALDYLQGFTSKKTTDTILLPLPLEGIRLRLRSDTGVETESDGTVLRWHYRLGRGAIALQSESAKRPKLVQNVLKGQPAIRFDGVDDFLQIEEPLLSSQQFTIVAVASDQQGSGVREILSNWNGGAGNSVTSVFLGLTGAATVRFSDAFGAAGAVASPSIPFILTAVSEAGGASVYQNRREIARVATPLPTRNLSPPYVLGTQGNFKAEFWKGDFYEIFVYDRALNAKELTTLWNDLNSRYGIAPLPPIADEGLASLCRILLNSNEFVYVD